MLVVQNDEADEEHVPPPTHSSFLPVPGSP